MAVNILTKEDLQEFKIELLNEINTMLEKGPAQPKRWLRSGELKQIFDLSPGTLQTLRINSTLKYSRIGGIIFYDYDHILQLLEENYQGDDEFQNRKKREMGDVLGRRRKN